jgi:hypothetical protein
MEYGS